MSDRYHMLSNETLASPSYARRRASQGASPRAAVTRVDRTPKGPAASKLDLDMVFDHKARPRDPEAARAGAAKPRGIARTKGSDSALVNVWVRNARAAEREGNRGLSHDRVELSAGDHAFA